MNNYSHNRNINNYYNNNQLGSGFSQYSYAMNSQHSSNTVKNINHNDYHNNNNYDNSQYHYLNKSSNNNSRYEYKPLAPFSEKDTNLVSHNSFLTQFVNRNNSINNEY